MSERLSMNRLRVDVEPIVGRAVRWRVLNAEDCAVLLVRCVTRIGAWL